MNEIPTVSIVTPSFNQAGFLEATICSVLEQDYPRIEYMICDGGSTDQSVHIIRKYESRLAWWCSEKDNGQSHAINKGWQRAQGEILAYLNSDDLYLPGAVSAVVDFLGKRPDVGVVFGDCQVIDAADRVRGLMRGQPFSVRRSIRNGEYILQPAAFWRRAVLDKVGLFDVNLRYALDYEYFIRVGLSFPVAYLPQSLACFRLHGESKTMSQHESHWREVMAVSQHYGLRPWHLWYWLRRCRHWGLRALPMSLSQRVRQYLLEYSWR